MQGLEEQGRVDFHSRVSIRAVLLGAALTVALLSVLLTLGGGLGLLPSGPGMDATSVRDAGTGLVAWASFSWLAAVLMEFTTESGDVGELRRRVRMMAEMRGRHGMMMGGGVEPEPGRGMGAGPDGGSHGGMMMGGGMMMMPAATASVEDIDRGARLVLRPTDPAQLEALRAHARMHVGHMARGECPMMSMRRAPPPRT